MLSRTGLLGLSGLLFPDGSGISGWYLQSAKFGLGGVNFLKILGLQLASGLPSRLVSRMKKFLLAGLVLAFMLGASAFAAQIGDTVQSVVTVANRVHLPPSSQPTTVTEIVLESGVWSISGQVNILSLVSQ